MTRIKPPPLLPILTSGYLTWKVKTYEKKIFLTFDDGPTPGVTDNILDLLDRYDVKATFFCVGKRASQFPVLYQQQINRGHDAGNHSFSHLDGWRTNSDKYIADIRRADNIIKSRLFRPPYGRITPRQAIKLHNNYRIIMWSLLAGDFDENTDKQSCLYNVLNYTKPGSIVVFHDSERPAEKCLYVLPRFLEYFLEKDFEFGTLKSIQ